MEPLKKGDFVKVGKEVGVVVFLENENETPEDHLSIWYGETNEQGNPKYRTVPAEYCEKTDNFEAYH